MGKNLPRQFEPKQHIKFTYSQTDRQTDRQTEKWGTLFPDKAKYHGLKILSEI